MSRLIDADKLIERIKEDTSEAKKKLSQCEYVDKEVWQRVIQIIESYIDVIEEQPTAYDLDKVLEKFDKYKDMYKRYIANYDMTFGESSRGKLRLVEHLEEIVKAGGIDE